MRLLFLISAICISAVINAQTLTVKASSNTIGLGQRVKLTYTLEGSDGNKFIQPTFEGFRLLSGPNTSSMKQLVNGRFSSSKSFSFVLLAEKLGEHTIPSASIKVKGNVIKSDPVTLKVVKNTQAKANNQAPKQAKNSSEVDLTTNLFLKLFVSKRDVYVGEQFVATYKLYTNVNIQDYSVENPSNTGFFAEEIDLEGTDTRTREVINEQQYEVFTLKKTVLTAQHAGEIELNPLKMDFVVQLRTNQRRSIWDPWRGFKNVSYSAQTNRQRINVKQLPTAGKPSDYTGAVGVFDLKVEQDRSELSLNEAVNLKVEISGKGNLKLIGAPNITFPQDFETYDPKLKESISNSQSGSRGKKTYEYVLIPRFTGQYEIDPISISFFNPEKGSYERVTSDPIVIDVAKSMDGKGSNEVAYMAPKKEDVQILGKDIRFIKDLSTPLSEPTDSFLGSPTFIALSALPIASTALALMLITRIRTRESDAMFMRKRKASSVAKKHLSTAHKAIDENGSIFYEEIFKALYGYVGDKFNISATDLNKENIKIVLLDKGLKKDLVQNLLAALEECEIARFAPGQAMAKETLLARGESLIREIENEV